MDSKQPEPELGGRICAKLKEKKTSRLHWPDKNGGRKIVLHPAYLAAIYSKEDSLRAVFHHAGA